MRWTITMAALLAAAVSSPAMAQEGRDGAKVHREMEHRGMMMGMMGAEHSMKEMLAAHAEELGLSGEQRERLDGLAERLSAEMERHHAEMHAIHEAAMEALTPEQRERVHALMAEMHEEGGMMGHGEKHGMAKDEEHEPEEEGGEDGENHQHDGT